VAATNRHDESLLLHGRASGLLPASHPPLDRAQHLPLHEEVDRFEQEGHERQEPARAIFGTNASEEPAGSLADWVKQKRPRPVEDSRVTIARRRDRGLRVQPATRALAPLSRLAAAVFGSGMGRAPSRVCRSGMSHVPITVRIRRPVNFGMTGLRRHQTDQMRLPDTGTVPLVRGEACLFALSAPSHRGWPPTPPTPSTPSLHPSNQAGYGPKRSLQRHLQRGLRNSTRRVGERPWSEWPLRKPSRREVGRLRLALHAEQARAQSRRETPGSPARRVALPANYDRARLRVLREPLRRARHNFHRRRTEPRCMGTYVEHVLAKRTVEPFAGWRSNDS
jgi:hypothetical protein